jgi:hypothetical protein
MYRTTIDPMAAMNDPALAPYFTGPALQQVVSSPESSPNLEVRAVFFGRGARSRWHPHPSPQIICVLSGVGLLGIDNTEQEVRLRVIGVSAPEEISSGADTRCSLLSRSHFAQNRPFHETFNVGIYRKVLRWISDLLE